MLSEKQQEEIREHLDRAQNPLFFFDNDADGLCSFLLFRRYLQSGKGVAVRSYPDLDERYAKKAEELKADYVFVLDKPVLSREFVKAVSDMGLPFVWIDHHNVNDDGEKFAKEFDNFFVYNSAKIDKGEPLRIGIARPEKGDEGEKPVTYWAYEITKRKEDMWIAMMGCIADHYLPDFASEFGKHYPDFWAKGIKKPFDAYYGTEIGKVAQSLGFGLKDSVTNVVQMQNFLIGVKNPDEVLSEEKTNYAFRKKMREMRDKYHDLVERAKAEIDGKLIFFSYGGEVSISAEVSNQLCYLYPEKYIAVAYKKGGISNVSLRGKGVKKILERVLSHLKDCSGGGHEDAVGARIKTDDLDKFKEYLEEEVGSK